MMDLLSAVLLLLLLRAQAQNPTVVRAPPGHNATLTCSLNTTSVFWYIEIRSQVRGLIARTFTADPTDTSHYAVTTLTNKYVAMGNQLVVTSITAEDYRLYFCGRKLNSSIVLADTLRLASDIPVTPCTCDSETNDKQQQHIWSTWPSELVIYGSFALNALLIVVVTGLVFTYLCLKRKNCNYQVTDTPSPFTCENTETLETPQYEEIQLRAPPPAAPPQECIYYKAQLPQSTLPQH